MKTSSIELFAADHRHDCVPTSLKMDPLSFSASLIAILGAAGTAIKGLEKLKTLYAAPKEIHSLIVEIRNMRLIIQQLDQAIQNRRQVSESQLSSMLVVSPLLDRAKERLEDVDKLINGRLLATGSVSDGNQVPKIRRAAWLRDKPKAVSLTVELQELRRNFTALVVLMHRYDWSPLVWTTVNLRFGCE